MPITWLQNLRNKKLKKFFFILFSLLTLSGLRVWGQTEPYPVVEVVKSHDKARIKGVLFYTHVVKEKQTLFSIAKAYGVSTLDIIDSNPKLELHSKPLRTGDILFIPIREVTEDPVITASATTEEKSKSQASFTLEQKPILSTDEIDLALLLPFNVTDSSASKNYLDFYFGSLLAVKRLSEIGLKIELNVIDFSADSTLTKTRDAIAKSDIIIGPVNSKDIEKTLFILPDNKFIVSPLDPKTETLCHNARVILAATPSHVQIKDAVEWMKSERTEGIDSLIVVMESGHKMTPTESTMIEAIDLESSEKTIRMEYSLSDGMEVNKWFASHTHLKDSLTRVMAASEHDIFVKDVIRNVYLQNNMKKNVTIYGPAKTKSDDMEEMCDARLHQSVTYHVDYTDPKVIHFVKDYRALFGGEPNAFSFQGYDIASYFISLYAKYADDWIENISNYTESGLQTFFHFKRDSGWEGAINEGIRRLVYSPGYKLEITER